MNRFVNILLLMFVINSLMYFFMPSATVNSINFINNFFMTDASGRITGAASSIDTRSSNTTLPTSMTGSTATTGGTGVIRFIFELGVVGQFLLFMIGFFILPVTILNALGLPPMLVMIFAGGSALLAVISIVFAIRGINE